MNLTGNLQFFLGLPSTRISPLFMISCFPGIVCNSKNIPYTTRRGSELSMAWARDGLTVHFRTPGWMGQWLGALKRLRCFCDAIIAIFYPLALRFESSFIIKQIHYPQALRGVSEANWCPVNLWIVAPHINLCISWDPLFHFASVSP